jgi:glutathione S-transferase
MKLYYAPGACSLASRISFHEAGRPVDFERVDIRSKVTEAGDDYTAINSKGYVPMLVLDNGETVTENVAILALIAECHPELGLSVPLSRTRLIEMLSYLSSELHIAFKPLWHSADEIENAEARQAVAERLKLIEDQLRDLYLFGPRFTVADAYLFVMLRWALAFDMPMSPALMAYFERLSERPAVRRALAEEALATLLPQHEHEFTIVEKAAA